MRQRVLFTLSMPSCGSWNGRWSGEGRNYQRVRTLAADKANEVAAKKWYSYRWNDGWGASVNVRLMEKGERLKKSDGFCGYDWMIDSIIRDGRILADHERQPVAAQA